MNKTVFEWVRLSHHCRNLSSSRFKPFNKAIQKCKSNWLCRCKTDREEEGHIVSGRCEVYEDLRSQFGDIGEDENLVKYFQAVLDRRDTLEEEEDRMWQPSTATVVASPVPGNRDRTSQSGDLHPIGLIQF